MCSGAALHAVWCHALGRAVCLAVVPFRWGCLCRLPCLHAATTQQLRQGPDGRTQVGGIFYARIVLSQPEQPQQSQPRGLGRPGAGSASSTGGRRIVSVDARPSDALSLALEAGVDVFVSRPVAQ